MDDDCITYFVAEITLGLLGVLISFNNSGLFVTMLMVAPESTQASSCDASLKLATGFPVAIGIDDEDFVLSEIIIVGARGRENVRFHII